MAYTEETTLNSLMQKSLILLYSKKLGFFQILIEIFSYVIPQESWKEMKGSIEELKKSHIKSKICRFTQCNRAIIITNSNTHIF
jgi:hypothetical protein